MNNIKMDPDFIEKLEKGERSAQEYFYDLFAPRILALCSRYLSNREEAQDAMIQSLLKALQKISTFKSEGSLEAWVRRIAINHCLSLLKRNMLYNLVSLSEVAEEFDEFAVESVDVDYLLKIIADMPPGYRAVFNLYVIEGYSHSEIADMLGISVSTSKSQLSRSRMLLQKKLKGLYPKNSTNEKGI